MMVGLYRPRTTNSAMPERLETGIRLLAEEHVGGDDRIWIEGYGVDSLFHEPLGQVGVVGGALAADPDILPLGFGGLDQRLQTLHDSWISLIEVLSDQTGITIKPQGQLGQVVAANGESVEVLKEFVSQEDIAR